MIKSKYVWMALAVLVTFSASMFISMNSQAVAPVYGSADVTNITMGDNMNPQEATPDTICPKTPSEVIAFQNLCLQKCSNGQKGPLCAKCKKCLSVAPLF